MRGPPRRAAPTGRGTRCMRPPRRCCTSTATSGSPPGPRATTLDLDYFLRGDNTIYLYAPAHQQRLLRPRFETITQQVVAAAQERAARSPDGMLNPRLGLFLDEAGNCAA